MMLRRTRHLVYCFGCGQAFYTNNADQLYCNDACKGKKYCRECRRSLPVVCFKDNKGQEHSRCRDCHYNNEPPPRERVCPDCGGDPGEFFRCEACTILHMRKYRRQGGDVCLNALSALD